MSRVVAMAATAIIAVLCGAIGPGQAIALTGPAVVPYGYDGHDEAAVLADTTTERGPPATHDRHTAYYAVDPRSHGASTRPDGPAPSHALAYDHPALLGQIARTTSTTRTGADGDAGDPSSLARSGSAAKAGAGAGDDLTRLYRAVDPAELKDIVGTGVYRSAPGGTEGKYFFATKAQAENVSNLMGKTGTGSYCITSWLLSQVGSQRHPDHPPSR